MEPLNYYFPHNIQIAITAPSPALEKQLEIVASVLRVDKELKVEVLTKEIEWQAENRQILINFWSKELKLLRACVTGFLRHMELVARTIQQFPPDQ